MPATDYWGSLEEIFTEPVISRAHRVIYQVPWDIGAIARAFQQEFVRTVDGVRIDEKITPAILFLPLFQIEFMTNYLSELASEQVEDQGRWPGNLSPEVQAWKNRIAAYKGTVQGCLNNGKQDDPKCTYDSVVSPLLLGYFPTADGGWKKQPADITFVYRWMNGLAVDASVRTEMGPWSIFGLFGEAAKEKGMDFAKIMYDAASEIIENSVQFVKDQYNWQKKMMPIALVAGGILGLAYLSSRYGGKTR